MSTLSYIIYKRGSLSSPSFPPQLRSVLSDLNDRLYEPSARRRPRRDRSSHPRNCFTLPSFLPHSRFSFFQQPLFSTTGKATIKASCFLTIAPGYYLLLSIQNIFHTFFFFFFLWNSKIYRREIFFSFKLSFYYIGEKHGIFHWL